MNRLTPEQLAELRTTREYYQKHKPSLEEAMAASGQEEHTTLGEVVEKACKKWHELTPSEQGAKAKIDGIPVELNPYRSTDPRHQVWRAAWSQQQQP